MIVAVPPVRPLDVFGPAEVLGDANRMRGGPPSYHVEVVAAGGERTVASHLGTPVHVDRRYDEAPDSAAGAAAGALPVDTLLVAGGLGARGRQYDGAFVAWLQAQAAAARRFGSICTGALVLAEAGLLLTGV